MNKNLIVQGLLAAAIIVLFVLHFTTPRLPQPSEEEVTPGSPMTTEVQMAYINLDSMIQEYQMFVDLITELQGTMEKKEAELNNKARQHQTNVADFQNKAQKGLETRATLEAMSGQLANDEQALLQLRDQYSQEIAEEEVVINRKVLNNIMEYLKQYNQGKNLHFVFTNRFGGSLLYANPQLDITEEVLRGLNAQYATSKAK